MVWQFCSFVFLILVPFGLTDWVTTSHCSLLQLWRDCVVCCSVMTEASWFINFQCHKNECCNHSGQLHAQRNQRKGISFYYFEMMSTNEQKQKLRKRRSQESEEIKRSLDVDMERFSYSYRSVTLLYVCECNQHIMNILHDVTALCVLFVTRGYVSLRRHEIAPCWYMIINEDIYVRVSLDHFYGCCC